MDQLDGAGVYCIVHCASGKRYYGSTKDFRARWRQHKIEAAAHVHCNKKLQHAIDHHGIDAFAFVVVERSETTDPMHLLQMEQRHLDRAALDKNAHYNICWIAGRGPVWSDLSEDRRAEISEAARVTQNRPDVKAKRTATKKATWADPAVRVARCAAIRAGSSRPEHHEARVARAKEIANRPEVRAAHTARLRDPAWRARHSAAICAALAQPAAHEQRCATMRDMANRPDVKAKKAATLERKRAPHVAHIRTLLATQPESVVAYATEHLSQRYWRVLRVELGIEPTPRG